MKLFSELVLAPNASSSSTLLSWPCANEFLNSYVKERIFVSITSDTIHGFRLSDLDSISERDTLFNLSEIDYRKYLTGRNRWFTGLWNSPVLDCPGYARGTCGATFRCIPPKNFSGFDSVAFLRVS
jgi:hypothetical protein